DHAPQIPATGRSGNPGYNAGLEGPHLLANDFLRDVQRCRPGSKRREARRWGSKAAVHRIPIQTHHALVASTSDCSNPLNRPGDAAIRTYERAHEGMEEFAESISTAVVHGVREVVE